MLLTIADVNPFVYSLIIVAGLFMGDIVIIISYAWMGVEEAKEFQPSVVFPDEHNRIPG